MQNKKVIGRYDESSVSCLTKLCSPHAHGSEIFGIARQVSRLCQGVRDYADRNLIAEDEPGRADLFPSYPCRRMHFLTVASFRARRVQRCPQRQRPPKCRRHLGSRTTSLMRGTLQRWQAQAAPPPDRVRSNPRKRARAPRQRSCRGSGRRTSAGPKSWDHPPSASV